MKIQWLIGLLLLTLTQVLIAAEGAATGQPDTVNAINSNDKVLVTLLDTGYLVTIQGIDSLGQEFQLLGFGQSMGKIDIVEIEYQSQIPFGHATIQLLTDGSYDVVVTADTVSD